MNKSEYKAFDNYAQELSRLQIENQQLKAELELYKNQSPLATQAFVTGYKSYKKQAENNYELWQKAEKVLDEIEGIVRKSNIPVETIMTANELTTNLIYEQNDKLIKILNIIKQAKEGGEC